MKYDPIIPKVVRGVENMTTDRLDWTIERKQLWIATNKQNGIMLVARTKSDLMSNINRWEKAGE